ncbi:MAG: phosphatase PAP2 family protein [[Clostridium] leptum]
MGISRVVAGLHYPRDVLAGAAVSLVVGGLGFWVVLENRPSGIDFAE